VICMWACIWVWMSGTSVCCCVPGCQEDSTVVCLPFASGRQASKPTIIACCTPDTRLCTVFSPPQKTPTDQQALPHHAVVLTPVFVLSPAPPPTTHTRRSASASPPCPSRCVPWLRGLRVRPSRSCLRASCAWAWWSASTTDCCSHTQCCMKRRETWSHRWVWLHGSPVSCMAVALKAVQQCGL
jgi:hypothetical protein